MRSLFQNIEGVNQVSGPSSLLPTYQPSASRNTCAGFAHFDTGTNAPRCPVTQDAQGQGKSNIVLRDSTNSATNNGTRLFSENFLHWCVKVQTASTRIAELEMKYLTEKGLVPRLLTTYNDLIGPRSWFTFTSCVGVRFYEGWSNPFL